MFCDPVGEQLHGGDEQPCGGRCDGALEVLGQSATTCPPNGNTQSAGIVGKGNGTTNAVAQAGTTTTTCPPAATTAALAASTAGTMTGGTSNGTTTAKTQ